MSAPSEAYSSEQRNDILNSIAGSEITFISSEKRKHLRYGCKYGTAMYILKSAKTT